MGRCLKASGPFFTYLKRPVWWQDPSAPVRVAIRRRSALDRMTSRSNTVQLTVAPVPVVSTPGTPPTGAVRGGPRCAERGRAEDGQTAAVSAANPETGTQLSV